VTARLKGRFLGVLAALSLAGFAARCARPVDETRFLNFDAESSSGRLASGWSGWERTADADTFVWAQGKSATVKVESRADDDRLVRFRAWPYRFAGAPPQTVTFFVNEARVESAAMAGAPHVYSFLAPKGAFRKGANDFRFEFAYSEAPRDHGDPSGDVRTLAAGFDWLEVLPPKPATKPK
jgi:hypothetical protein